MGGRRGQRARSSSPGESRAAHHRQRQFDGPHQRPDRERGRNAVVHVRRSQRLRDDEAGRERPVRRASRWLRATIVFTSTVQGSAVTGAVDAAKAKPCASSFTATYEPGQHQVVVTAISPAKIVDRSAAVVGFTVAKTR